MRWLSARTARSPVEDRALTRASLPAAMLPDPGQGEPIPPDVAMRIADCFACVRVLADTAASLPLHAYRRTATGGRERFPGRFADLLARPAPATTTANLIGTVMAHLALHGNAYLAKYRDEQGTVRQIAPLAPRSVTVALEAGEPVYTLMRAEGVSRHGPEDILHVRGLSTDGLVGLSPVGQARQALGLSLSLAGHADAFARNAGRPGGILNIKQPPHPTATPESDAAEHEGLKAKFQGLFTGERSGQVMVIAADQLEYTQLALSMADAEFVAQRQLSTAEVARIFRVPVHMIGGTDGSSMTYSNVESQAASFLKFTLAPWLATIEQALSADPDFSPSPAFCAFVVDGFLRADAQTRSNVYSAAIASGYMTVDEIRALENLPPLSPAPTRADPRSLT